MKVITFLNEKGGVGKTTLATAFASILASEYRVLVIDTDSQGHSTLRLRTKREDGFYCLLGENWSWRDVLRAVPPAFYGGDVDDPRLWLIPGNSGTRKLGNGLNTLLLKRRLAEIEAAFDFVIIDTSPAINDIHTALYAASDYLVFPTECTFLSIQGIINSLDHLEAARRKFTEKGVPCAQPLGVIPNRFNGKKSLHYQNLGWLQGRYGEQLTLFSSIRFLTAWEQAEQMGQPVHLYKRGRTGAKSEALNMADEILSCIQAGVA